MDTIKQNYIKVFNLHEFMGLHDFKIEAGPHLFCACGAIMAINDEALGVGCTLTFSQLTMDIIHKANPEVWNAFQYIYKVSIRSPHGTRVITSENYKIMDRDSNITWYAMDS